MLKRVRHSLTAEELTELAALLRRAFDCISQLKATNPAAAPIQYPKLPSIFSESLVQAKLREMIEGKLERLP